MQLGFIDIDKRHAQLSKQGDPLERLNAVIDWELFRPVLAKLDRKPRKSAAGRKPIDRVLMFKLLILQRLHNIADEQLEYLVKDRLFFMRFLGLALGSPVPDARTVWAFREELKTHQLVEVLFDTFNQALKHVGVEMKSGQIIDATFIPVPVQRNSREDNATIKAGQTPEHWSAKQAAHKDVDARFVKKGGQTHCGYKDSINIDAYTKLITCYQVTDASVHDSQMLQGVLQSPEAGGKTVHADSAYRSAETEAKLQAQGYDSLIHERGYKNKPLTEEQTAFNKDKSSVRARVEHVFGYIQTSMGGKLIRTIGIARARVNIGLMNLSYNLKRVETLIRKGLIEIQGVGAPKTGKMA